MGETLHTKTSKLVNIKLLNSLCIPCIDEQICQHAHHYSVQLEDCGSTKHPASNGHLCTLQEQLYAYTSMHIRRQRPIHVYICIYGPPTNAFISQLMLSHFVSTRMCIYICIYTCTCEYACVAMCTRVSVHTQSHIHTRAYIDIYIQRERDL